MIKAILWDVDGTLLDFKAAEMFAIRKCFSDFSLGICTDEMLARYSKINHGYWRKLEAGKITKQEVLHGRFQEFFQKEGISFNKIKEFNEDYQSSLGDTYAYCDNGEELVRQLKGKVIQYGVTNGTQVAQRKKLKNSGLDQILDDVFISDIVGAEKPNKEFFVPVLKKLKEYKKDEIMIVGDSLTSDMQGGNNVDIICCWYNPSNSKNDKNLRIDYEITNLHQILEILNMHN